MNTVTRLAGTAAPSFSTDQTAFSLNRFIAQRPALTTVRKSISALVSVALRVSVATAFAFSAGVPASADILVSNYGSHSLEWFTDGGAWIDTFATTGPYVPYDVAQSPTTGMVVATTMTPTLLRYDASGKPLAFFDSLVLPTGANPGSSAVFDSAGTLYEATNYGTSAYVAQIFKYTSAQLMLKNPTPTLLANTGLRPRTQIAFDRSGHLCVASFIDETVKCYDPNSGVLRVDYTPQFRAPLLTVATPEPGGLAFDGANRLYVSSILTGQVAGEVNPLFGPLKLETVVQNDFRYHNQRLRSLCNLHV